VRACASANLVSPASSRCSLRGSNFAVITIAVSPVCFYVGLADGTNHRWITRQ
jgi:hypothetical protein